MAGTALDAFGSPPITEEGHMVMRMPAVGGQSYFQSADTADNTQLVG